MPSRYEFQILHKSGEERWVEFTAGTISYEGELIGLGTAFDITERKRVEKALAKSEARYRRLVESAPDAIVVHDLEGRYLEANEATHRLWGYSREEMVSGVRAGDIDPVCTPEKLRELWPTLREKGVMAVEAQTRASDGSPVPVDVRVAALDHDPERPLILGIIRDIRERHQLEEQLRQATKMEAVGRLAGGVAHDFNMLHAIGGFAALLRDEVQSGDAVEYVKEIQNAAARAADLTRQLLAFGRKQILQPKTLELNAVVRDADRLLRRLIPESIEIESHLDPSAGWVEVDPTQMHQVLINLALNARDAMPDGGVLRIETARRRIDGRDRQRPYLVAGSYAQLSVSDTGHGMTPEVLAKVFEPFFTTKPQGQGTGLGLSTVYGIVRQSGGYVWMESEPDGGTTATVLLPVAPGPVTTEDAAPEDTRTSGWGFVLLVEDEDAVRRVSRRMLEKLEYTMLEARDGREALERFEEHRERIVLVVTGLVMPRLGGYLLAQSIQKRSPEMPVVLMSGHAEDLVRSRELSPRTAFVQKPFSWELLVQTLERLL